MQTHVERRGAAVRVRVEGELDLDTSSELRRLLDEEIAQGVHHVVVDLADVPFLDSSGLGVLLGRYRRLKEVGGSLAVVAPQPQVLRILELSGIPRIIPVLTESEEGR